MLMHVLFAIGFSFAAVAETQSEPQLFNEQGEVADFALVRITHKPNSTGLTNPETIIGAVVDVDGRLFDIDFDSFGGDLEVDIDDRTTSEIKGQQLWQAVVEKSKAWQTSNPSTLNEGVVLSFELSESQNRLELGITSPMARYAMYSQRGQSTSRITAKIDIALQQRPDQKDHDVILKYFHFDQQSRRQQTGFWGRFREPKEFYVLATETEVQEFSIHDGQLQMSFAGGYLTVDVNKNKAELIGVDAPHQLYINRFQRVRLDAYQRPQTEKRISVSAQSCESVLSARSGSKGA